MTHLAQAVSWLRGRSRWFKFGILMVATWPFVLLAAHPLAAFLIAVPAGGLFFVATKGLPDKPPAGSDAPVEDSPHETT